MHAALFTAKSNETRLAIVWVILTVITNCLFIGYLLASVRLSWRCVIWLSNFLLNLMVTWQMTSRVPKSSGSWLVTPIYLGSWKLNIWKIVRNRRLIQIDYQEETAYIASRTVTWPMMSLIANGDTLRLGVCWEPTMAIKFSLTRVKRIAVRQWDRYLVPARNVFLVFL